MSALVERHCRKCAAQITLTAYQEKRRDYRCTPCSSSALADFRRSAVASRVGTAESLRATLRFTDLEIERFWSKVSIGSPDQCWPWNGARNTSGYGRIVLTRNWVQVGYFAHRLALAFVSERMPAPDVLAMHACDNPICCNPHHLEWGTKSQNAKDAYARLPRKSAKSSKHDLTGCDELYETASEIATLAPQGDVQ